MMISAVYPVHVKKRPHQLRRARSSRSRPIKVLITSYTEEQPLPQLILLADGIFATCLRLDPCRHRADQSTEECGGRVLGCHSMMCTFVLKILQIASQM